MKIVAIDQRDIIKYYNIFITGVLEEEKKENEAGEKCDKIMIKGL